MNHPRACDTVFLTACLLLPAVRAAGDDWPAFRGGDRQGHSAAKSLPTAFSPDKNVLWKTALPGPGGSSPILVGKRIYLTCYTGYAVPGRPRGDIEDLKRHLVCLDRATGKILWTRDTPAAQPEATRNREDHGYATNTPAADAERVYVFYGKSGVFAYSHEGKKLWQAEVGAKTSGWGSAASPILCGNLLIVNASVESGSLIALDKTTGKATWRASGIKESWNTPILVPAREGLSELVLAIHGSVLGFDPASGKQLWSCETNIPWYMVPSLVTDGHRVYAIGGRGRGGALAVRPGGRGDVTATHRLWKIRKGSNVPSPIYHEGHLYFAHESGKAVCLEARTGRVVYEQPLPRAGQIYASPILADGKLYYLSRGGRCYVLAASPEFKLLATHELGRVGTINASPAAETGRLYIRSNQFLFCFGRE